MRINKCAFSIIEYSLFIALILTALYISKDFIGRSMMGRWRAAGDTFAFGRQYDPTRTLDCAFDGELNLWYDQSCFDQQRRVCGTSDFECEKRIINSQCATSACGEF